METVIFCHGLPGSPADADLLRQANPNHTIIALDILSVDPCKIDQDLVGIFKAALKEAGADKVHMVGFSIGAMVATRLAALHPESISRLTLVSPAAPLSLGDFLPHMAGKPVFVLAMKHPKLLTLLTNFQGVIARVAPAILIWILFSRCGASEKTLLKSPPFRSSILEGLSCSFQKRPAAYLAYISEYVTDWSDVLSAVTCPVDLWHGSKDTWSPTAMSEKLCSTFGDKAVLNVVREREHYSTLSYVMLNATPTLQKCLD